jgi:hypothetical protein
MALAGWAHWPDDGHPPFMVDEMYLNGTMLPWHEVQEEPAPSCVASPTHGGTHQFWRPFRGALKPKDYSALAFSFDFQADDYATWAALDEAKATCAPFYFTAGLRKTDTFPATSGTVYRLSRPLASGIVPGVTSGTHPVVVKLNGVVDAGAATVAGQNATANDTGTISIEYTPVHLVYFTAFPLRVDAYNSAVRSVGLQETLIA